MENVSSGAGKLISEIARCAILNGHFDDETLNVPCTALIRCQSPLSRSSHQVPEPWSGHLESAPILFFGSNPSINPVEVFPTFEWQDDEINDFFANRFEGGSKPWVHKLRVLRHDGSHGDTTTWVRFWAACRGRATELLGRRANDGVDYAITEAVHCKSKGEIVLAKAVTKAAAATCADRFLQRIVELSPAKAIVSFGGIADQEIRRVFNLGQSRYERSGERRFIFVDHPAGAGAKKKIASVLSDHEIAELRKTILNSKSGSA